MMQIVQGAQEAQGPQQVQGCRGAGCRGAGLQWRLELWVGLDGGAHGDPRWLVRVRGAERGVDVDGHGAPARRGCVL